MAQKISFKKGFLILIGLIGLLIFVLLNYISSNPHVVSYWILDDNEPTKGDLANWAAIIIEIGIGIFIAGMIFIYENNQKNKDKEQTNRIEELIKKTKTQQDEIAKLITKIENIEVEQQKIITEQNRIQQERSDYAENFLQWELERLDTNLENMIMIRGGRNSYGTNKETTKKIGEMILYHKSSLENFLNLYGIYLKQTNMQRRISEFCRFLDYAVKAENSNDPNWDQLGQSYFELKEIFKAFPKHKEIEVTPPSQLKGPWLKCENCGKFPGINICEINGKPALKCENCGFVKS